MIVNGVPTLAEEKQLEDIRSAPTRRLLARYGEAGLYLFDRQARAQCLLSYQELLVIVQERAPHLLHNS